MFKKIINFLLIFCMIISVSTVCLATDETTSEGDAVVTSVEGEGTEGVELISAEGEEHTHTEGEDHTHTHTDTEGATTEEGTVAETEEVYIANDHYEINSTVTIDENTIIDGNAYIIAQDVVIKGRIVGDLFVMANNVTIDGAYVYNNVFVLANTFSLKGQGVVYQLYAACNDVNIESEGIVYRDLLATASNLTLKGSVGRDAYISAEQLNIVANETGTNIYNNLEYSAKSEIEIPEGAVAGEVKYTAITSTESSTANNPILNYVFDLVFALVFTSVVFLLVILLTPKFVKNSHTLLTTSLGKTTIVGLIVFLVVPIISIILLFSYIAVPVSVVLMVTYILLLSIGTALISICIANLIMNKMKKDKKFILYLLTLAINVVIWLLNLVPYLNIFIAIVIAIYTFGLVFTNLLPKKEKLKEISKEEA